MSAAACPAAIIKSICDQIDACKNDFDRLESEAVSLKLGNGGVMKRMRETEGRSGEGVSSGYRDPAVRAPRASSLC